MTITAISSARTVPVSVDLTTEETRLSIIRGLENMKRVDYPLEGAAQFDLGEWAVLNASNKLERPSATPKPNTYLVIAGTDRFDSHALKQATVAQNSAVIAKTSHFDTAPTYAVGDGLTVKDLGGGEADLTKAGGSDPIVARYLKTEAGLMFFETTLR